MPNSGYDVFPEVFCIEDIRCVRREGGTCDCHATLYHDRASIAVVFNVAERNAQLVRGRFVSVDWLPNAVSEHGEVRVGGLQVRDCSACGFNPFQSVPHSWCVDRHQVECARDLWDASSQQLRKLLFRTFWGELHAKYGGAGKRLTSGA